MVLGTARIASADVMITIGSTSAAMVMPAAMTFFPSVDPPRPMPLTNATNIVRPSSPKTIDGTPARLRTAVSIHRVRRLSGAYSSR